MEFQEESFWHGLIERYLKPLDENKEQQKKIKDELIQLK